MQSSEVIQDIRTMNSRNSSFNSIKIVEVEKILKGATSGRDTYIIY